MGAARNVDLIKWDLNSTITVPLPGMIRLLTQLKGVREDNLPLDLEALQAYGNEQFNILLEESVAFCNNECTEKMRRDSSKVKGYLAEALKQRAEKNRYQPLVNAFNEVLDCYGRKAIGKLGVPDDTNDFLFIVNDPIPIESQPLSDITPHTTQRRPDIQDILIKDLSWLCGDEFQDSGNETWTTFIAKGDFSRIRKQVAKKDKRVLGWRHVSTCFEIKAIKPQSHTILEDGGYRYSLQDMQDLAEKRPKEYVAPTDSESYESHGDPKNAATGAHIGYLTRDSDSQASAKSGARSNPSTGSKRKTDEGIAPSPKKAKTEAIRISPAVQCGFYAVELMRSFPDRTHAIVLLLTDSNLVVRYHDPQGCIATEPMDLITGLPYLVALLIVFQRFRNQMRGRGHFDMSVEQNGRTIAFELPLDARTRWELRGRRPVTGVPVTRDSADDARPKAASHLHKSGPATAGPETAPGAPGPSQKPVRRTTRRSTGAEAMTKRDVSGKRVAPPTQAEPQSHDTHIGGSFRPLEDYFLKVSWREVARDAEGHIVATAKERALHYLGEHATSVTNHLPNIIGHGEFEIFSTGLPRELLGFRVEADPGAARIPTWTLMERLVSMNELHPTDFKARFWEIIRCHSLLWRLGVAHGDVSFNNLMLSQDKRRAVLNDYDLAALMTPGKVSPTKKGFERTGTKPFMAMELLLCAAGHMTYPRLYRHDFESIVWCMVWYCKEQLDWLHGDYGEVHEEKARWFTRLSLAVRADNKAHLYPVPDGIRAGTEELWHNIVDLYTGLKGMELHKQEPLLRDWVYMAEKVLPRNASPCSWEWNNFEVAEDRIRPIDQGDEVIDLKSA